MGFHILLSTRRPGHCLPPLCTLGHTLLGSQSLLCLQMSSSRILLLYAQRHYIDHLQTYTPGLFCTHLCSLSADNAHVQLHTHTHHGAYKCTQCLRVTSMRVLVHKDTPISQRADPYGDTMHTRTQFSPLRLCTPYTLDIWAPCPPPFLCPL